MISITITPAHTTGVVATFEGRAYVRTLTAPTGRMLFLDVETGEPLLVQVGREHVLPTFDHVAALLHAGFMTLDFEFPEPPEADDARGRPFAPRHEAEVLNAKAGPRRRHHRVFRGATIPSIGISGPAPRLNGPEGRRARRG